MHIHRKHNLGRKEARRRVDRISGSLADSYRLRSNWDGDDLRFSGSGVSGCIRVGEDCLDMDVELGFALRMLEGSIRASVEQAIDEHLSQGD